MTPILQSLEFSLISLMSFFTGKLIVLVAAFAVVPNPAPEWLDWVLGPLGALVVMVVAIGWLTRRLDATEQREAERQKQRDLLLTQMVEVNTKLEIALESNTHMLERVNSHLEKHQ